MQSNTKKSLTNIRENVLFYSDDVARHGFLTKSPPQELFSKQSSWKKRYFLLIRTSKGYSLQYFASQNLRNPCKGEITLDKVLAVQHGLSNPEKMGVVRRMFGCTPEELITISMAKRDYYLIGENRAETQDWFDEIYKAFNQKGTDAAKQLVGEDGRQRSISWSVNQPSLAQTSSQVSNSQRIDLVEEEARQRSISLSVNLSSLAITSSHVSTCQMIDDTEKSNQMSEDSDSPDEDTYDIPPPLIRCNSDRDGAELEDLLQSEDPDDSQKVKCGTYMSMKAVPRYIEPIYVNVNPTQTMTISQDPPDFADECDGKTQLNTSEVSTPDCSSACFPLSSPDSEVNGKSGTISPTNAPRLRKTCVLASTGDEKRRSRPTSLELMQLFGTIKPSQFIEVVIELRKEGISTCLELLKVEDRLCVSLWKDPGDLGCLFHYGDHILAVNDIAIHSKEELFRTIGLARREKVKVAIQRVPGSDILHAEECKCP